MTDSKVIKMAVYDPPGPDFPYLAVTIGLDGEVLALPFDTMHEAEAYNQRAATDFARAAAEDPDRN